MASKPESLDNRGAPPDRRVVVIGGGLAGASAALALARSGTRVTLVESRSRLGGRTGSYTDPISGQAIDYCQHVGMACCTSLRQLIQWLEQEPLWQVQRELHFYGPDGREQTLRALPWVPAPLHLAPWLLRWPGLNWRDRLGVARAMLALDRVPLSAQPADTADELEDTSALQWLQRRGQSARAIACFWSTVIVSALGEELSRVGLLAMAKVFQDGFLRERTAFHLLVPQRPLGELFGERLQRALVETGVEVLTGVAATGLNWIAQPDWPAARAESVNLADGRCLQASAVIVAVPWHAVERLMVDCPDPEVRRLAHGVSSLESSPISGVHTWWERPWLTTPHAVLVDRLCQWVFPRPDEPREADETASAASPAVSPSQSPSLARTRPSEHYYQIVISASRSLPRGDNEAVRQLIEADLRAVFPAARATKLLRVKTVTDPHAVFSVAPGTSRLRPPLGSRAGNLIWAGDWVRTGWPATMEGAIRSGLAAARAATDLPARSQPGPTDA
ncbi:MAG: hydroxysqualene dehydroxylase HpnE [Aureliella sp.]